MKTTSSSSASTSMFSVDDKWIRLPHRPLLPQHPPKRSLGDREPLPNIYPESRPPEESMRYCSVCVPKQRQQRRIIRFGPMEERFCINVPEKKPRCSGQGIWIHPLLAWLFATPKVPRPGKRWWQIEEKAMHSVCGRHGLKVYRRQFPLWREWAFFIHDWISSKFD